MYLFHIYFLLSHQVILMNVHNKNNMYLKGQNVSSLASQIPNNYSNAFAILPSSL